MDLYDDHIILLLTTKQMGSPENKLLCLVCLLESSVMIDCSRQYWILFSLQKMYTHLRLNRRTNYSNLFLTNDSQKNMSMTTALINSKLEIVNSRKHILQKQYGWGCSFPNSKGQTLSRLGAMNGLWRHRVVTRPAKSMRRRRTDQIFVSGWQNIRAANVQ